ICSPSNTGSINIPTDTKKTAPNKCFTDFTRCSMRSACVVSASIEPMMKAPNGAEKPTYVASTTINKHKPSEITSIVSSFSNLRAHFKKVGSRKMPEINHTHRKNNNLRTEVSISVPSNSLLTARVDNITISTTATRSSITSTPNTTAANFC